MTSHTFNFQEHQIRVVGTVDSPEFIAADVCKALELKRKPSAAIRNFNNLEKGVLLTHTLGGKQRLLTVKEPGLYKLIFRSDAKNATEFQNWLAHEVLPAIRKQGYYATPAIPEPPIQKELPLETPPTTTVPEITAIAEAINLVFERSRVNRRVIALATAEAIAQQHPALKTTMSIAQKYLQP
jgi:prophage antirepressor-like protein